MQRRLVAFGQLNKQSIFLTAALHFKILLVSESNRTLPDRLMVLLLGDAANTMSSVGGQGVDIAIRDRIVAANSLSLRKKTYVQQLSD